MYDKLVAKVYNIDTSGFSDEISDAGKNIPNTSGLKKQIIILKLLK